MIIRIFAATESATLPIWTANQGGSFAFMRTLRLYTKQALPISEQIELLKSRGLNFADSSKAAKFLGEVSYFRFVQYLRPMEADKTTLWLMDRFGSLIQVLLTMNTSLLRIWTPSIENFNVARRTLSKSIGVTMTSRYSLQHGKRLNLHLSAHFQNSITISVTRSWRSVPLPINRFGLRKWNALGRYSMSFCRKQIGEMCLPYLYL